MPEIPKIVSVDDHVIEPAGVWQDRLPAAYKEKGPRLDRRKVRFSPAGKVPGVRQIGSGKTHASATHSCLTNYDPTGIEKEG